MSVISRLAAAAAVFGAATSAPAQEFRPALIYDIGGKFDRSFNEASYEGAKRFMAERPTGDRHSSPVVCSR